MNATRFTIAILAAALLGGNAMAQDDPYLWLEDVTGDKAIAWAKEQNATSTKVLEAVPQFASIRDRTLEILNSRDRIPYVSVHDKWLYNFWRDEKNVRGIWRRTTMEEFRKPGTRWETVLDLDQLAKAENENWVWQGSTCVYPTYDRCLISLSRGGADAKVIREFDVAAKVFVKDGFQVREAKGSAAWIDKDTIFVATDFGPGSMTESGYPRLVKEWKRGTPLENARLVFEGKASDLSIDAIQYEARGYPKRQIVTRALAFYSTENFLRDPRSGSLEKIDVPLDAVPSFVHDLLFVELRSDWSTGNGTWPKGAMLAIDADKFMRGSRDFAMLFEPGERKSLAGFSATKTRYILNELDNVRNVLYELSYKDGKWTRTRMDHPKFGSIGAWAVDDDAGDEYFMNVTDFLTPATLYLGTAGETKREKVRVLPAFFDAAPYAVEQFEASSKDGEKIPYFVVRAKTAKADATSPTYLYAYGGFEISMLPYYSGTVGSAWLANGGTYVLANLRGGGEFGPRWHQAGLKANRQRVFDDLIAVAEDLVTRKITSPRHLAIGGGSNGGLLVGAVLLQRPDLFRAVVCQVPLLDMKRYNKLLAGASWMAEYGNPDIPEEWDYISKYSPYQNVKKGVQYPRVFFDTSTRDDRVHPGHARKMVARMLEQGHEVLYYENIEGGHAGAADNPQKAYITALEFAFLLQELQ